MCLTYIFLFSSTPERLIRHIEMLSRLLRNDEVAFKLQKCAAFRKNDYLSHIIWSRRFKVAKSTADAISNFKTPPTVNELWSVHGFYSVFRSVLPNLARAASSQLRLFNKPQAKNLPPQEEEELRTLRTAKETIYQSSYFHRRSRIDATSWNYFYLTRNWEVLFDRNRMTLKHLTDRVLLTKPSLDKNETWLSRTVISCSSCRHSVITYILRMCRTYDSHGQPRTLMNSKTRWFYGQSGVLRAPSNGTWFWDR